MARIPKCRRVEFYPRVTTFKPGGSQGLRAEFVSIRVEELEAVRLKDYLGLEQEECAQKMQVSRPTFQRILVEARKKIADALINGKELQVEGGDYCLGQEPCRRKGRHAGKYYDCPFRRLYDENYETVDTGASTKVVVCSSGDDPQAPVDGRFGRCAFFLVWDLDNGGFESWQNSGTSLSQGAGMEAAREIIRQGAKAVIASRIGRKAFAALRKSGVDVFTGAEGMKAGEAIEEYKAGRLKKLDEPDS